MQRRTRSERVLLPAGVTPGSIIGPKGAIVTEIRRSTGASVAVKDTYVVVTGSPSAVKSAIDRLLALFRTAQVKGKFPLT
jgi:rRNA processing protein Krr1/Pno1